MLFEHTKAFQDRKKNSFFKKKKTKKRIWIKTIENFEREEKIVMLGKEIWEIGRFMCKTRGCFSNIVNWLENQE